MTVLSKVMNNELESGHWRSLDFLQYGKNYLFNTSTYEVLNVKTGKILKQRATKDHLYVDLSENGKYKNYSIHQIVWAVHNNSWYNTRTMNIDHIDRNPRNNNIENLRLVPYHVNSTNLRHHKVGMNFEYKDDIGVKEIINDYCKVYYSKTYKKFYRWVESEYREIHETKRGENSYRIQWWFKCKKYQFTTTDYFVINRI